LKELKPGDLIADRFRVEALLGEGGIARVYRVRHVRLGSVHAVKILTLIRPALADRLLLEGRIQAQLQHPNLVRVTDVAEHEGQPCLVMEYVAGSNLQILLAEQLRLELEPGLRLMSGVISAVATAHDLGVLHRDLKPANILLARSGGRWIPKVSDFGIAKVATEGLRDGETKAGVQMGTPGYMAPEQIEDSAQVDHRADIFALGAVLYETLSGHRPFQQDTTFRTLQATILGELVPLQERVAGVPPHVAEAVQRCLKVEMEDRFQDCHELADALFAAHPELRRSVRRAEPEAAPEGLRRPEITASTPTPSLGVLPVPTPLGPSLSLGEGAAAGGTLAPADDSLYSGPGPSTGGPAASGAPKSRSGAELVGGIAPGRELAADSGGGKVGLSPSMGGPDLGGASSRLAASLSPRSGAAEATLSPGATFSGDDLDAAGTPAGGADEPLDEERSTPASRGGARWVWPLLAVAAGIGLVGGGLALRGSLSGLPVEQVVAPPAPVLAQASPTGPEAPALPSGSPDAAPAPAAPTSTVAPPTVAPPTVAPPTVAPATVAPATVAPPTVAPATVAPPVAAPILATAPAPAAPAPVDAGPDTPPDVASDARVEAAAPASAPAATPAPDASADVSADVSADASADATSAATEPVADAADAAQAPEVPTTPPPLAPPVAPAVTGTWSGMANDLPLTIRILSQDGEQISGELTFTQGATVHVAQVSGTITPTRSIRLIEGGGGSGLTFTGVVRGTGMMGTYGRTGKESELSWSATRK